MVSSHDLWEFARLADARGEHERAETWRAARQRAQSSRSNARLGTATGIAAPTSTMGRPLGSAVNAECRIDSIAQSWSVFSGAAEPARGARAMAAVDEYLIRRGDGLVLLFTPPFDHATPTPATSRAICRASARTAASTPMRRSGR